MTPIITAEKLSKRYTIGAARKARQSLKETLASGTRELFRRRRAGAKPETEVWALNDVSFSVEPGEAVGIVGRNGAGKSTLLKILSRITEPTEGRAILYGRVASLLEVGTGFHHDLTGRENIFLNGAILGMSHAEIRRKLDDIVAFAEIEKFVDTVVKHYSSGMYMRLAFAVAAHLEPEILIVDEVLAVGDMAFQRKCIGKMKDVTGEGRTVLFVSHNLSAIESLCDRALLFENGRMVMDGPAGDVTSRYASKGIVSRTERRWTDAEHAPAGDGLILRLARVTPAEGDAAGQITVRTPILLDFVIEVRKKGIYNLSLHVFDEHGTLLFNSFPPDVASSGGTLEEGLHTTSCTIPGDLLNAGRIRIDVLCARDRGTLLFREEGVLSFEVLDTPDFRGGWWGHWQGAVRPILRWKTEAGGGELSVRPPAEERHR